MYIAGLSAINRDNVVNCRNEGEISVHCGNGYVSGIACTWLDDDTVFMNVTTML